MSAFGDDGLGGFAHTIASNKKEEDQNAVDFLVEYVNGHPKEITLFAIGPCTNIAHAIRKSPDFAGNLKRLIIMGGAKYTGNMSPVAEYNFWADPMAAHEVLMSGIQDVTMIVFFFGGATGGGASMLAAGLMATGKQILESVLSVYIVTESVGKLISVFIAYFIIKAIPERSLVKYKYGEKFIKTKSN